MITAKLVKTIIAQQRQQSLFGFLFVGFAVGLLRGAGALLLVSIPLTSLLSLESPLTDELLTPPRPSVSLPSELSLAEKAVSLGPRKPVKLIDVSMEVLLRILELLATLYDFCLCISGFWFLPRPIFPGCLK